MIYFDNHHGDRKKQKTVPWLSSPRSGLHVLQLRCQPTPTPIYIECFTASVPTEANYYIHILMWGAGVGLAMLEFRHTINLAVGAFFDYVRFC